MIKKTCNTEVYYNGKSHFCGEIAVFACFDCGYTECRFHHTQEFLKRHLEHMSNKFEPLPNQQNRNHHQRINKESFILGGV